MIRSWGHAECHSVLPHSFSVFFPLEFGLGRLLRIGAWPPAWMERWEHHRSVWLPRGWISLSYKCCLGQDSIAKLEPEKLVRCRLYSVAHDFCSNPSPYLYGLSAFPHNKIDCFHDSWKKGSLCCSAFSHDLSRCGTTHCLGVLLLKGVRHVQGYHTYLCDTDPRMLI